MLLVITLGSYLMGSLSFAILLSRWLDLPDPREQGSGNPGISNLLRLGHKRLAVVVLLSDALKTIIPVLIAKSQGFNETQLAWCVTAASIGHMFPVFFDLRGSKGIVPTLGGLFVISWPVAGIATLVWAGVFLFSRYASLASMVAIISALISATVFCQGSTHMPIALIAGILLARHSSNWDRLLRGQEPKIKILDHL